MILPNSVTLVRTELMHQSSSANPPRNQHYLYAYLATTRVHDQYQQGSHTQIPIPVLFETELKAALMLHFSLPSCRFPL